MLVVSRSGFRRIGNRIAVFEELRLIQINPTTETLKCAPVKASKNPKRNLEALNLKNLDKAQMSMLMEFGRGLSPEALRWEA